MTEKDEKVLEAYGFYNQKSLNEDYWYLWKEELLARPSGYVDMQITTMDIYTVPLMDNALPVVLMIKCP